MARAKRQSRVKPGEYMFTNPREAAAFTRKALSRGGEAVYGTRHAMSAIGVHPHHYISRSMPDRKMPDAEAELLAQQTDDAAGRVTVSYSPTRTSNPQDPRTSAAGYDPQTQRLYVEWGDGGTPYYYYDVTPQEWDAFQRTDSPGRFINAILNEKNYGPVSEQ